MTERNKETPWSTVGYLCMKRTYARRLDDTGTETEEWKDVVDRVVRGCNEQLGCDFTEEEQDRLRQHHLALRGTVAGRFLWQVGTSTVDRLGLPSLQNCFAIETEFITSDGIKSFRDFRDGDRVVVRGKKGWKTATIHSFGKQEMLTLEVRKGSRTKTYKTTPNHRWILRDNAIRTTDQLKPGDKLRSIDKGTNHHHIDPCKIAIQHGLVFGDGHYEETSNACALIPCGDSAAEVRSFFWQDKGTKGIYGLPNFWKKLPSLESNKHYLLGFMAGWFAADGSVGKEGSCVVLANKDEAVLNWARGALAKLCITCSDVTVSRELSPFDGSDKPLYRITLDRENLPEDFFLLEKHRTRFSPLKTHHDWTVESVAQSCPDVAWCIREPENEEFSLANGILTKNCAAVVVDEPVRPFTWTMDMLMLGCGVGFNLQREHVYELPKVREDFVKPVRKDEPGADYIVPDSREGWVKLLEYTLRAAYEADAKKGFSYSCQLIRGSGAPIRGFGGTASGSEVLSQGISSIGDVLANRKGKKLRPIDCLDIMNIIGSIVVAGNVRRSAQIAIGDMDDFQFLRSKRWDLGNVPNWRANSNNSVVCNDFALLPDEIWKGYLGNGEPFGLINLKLARKVGRTGETQYPDKEVIAFNP